MNTSWDVAFRRFVIACFTLILSSPVVAVDTLTVKTPDPILENWRWTAFDRSDGLVGYMNNIYEDREGNVWFATDSGVRRYDGLRWTTYTTEDGLVSNIVRTIMQAREGAMWFGTTGGISRFDGEHWTTYTVADSLPINRIGPQGLLQARDGTIWAGFSTQGDSLGTQSGIGRFDGKKWVAIDVPGNAPRPLVLDIHEAADGSLWFATGGQGVLRYKNGQWTRYTTADGLGGNSATDIMEARDGALWFGISGNESLCRFDGVQWRTYTSRDGLPEGIPFNRLWQTRDGTVWAGGWGTIARFNASIGSGQGGERWTHYNLQTTGFTGVVKGYATRDGAMWLYQVRSARDVFRVDLTSTQWTVYTELPAGVTSFSAADQLFVYDDDVWLTALDGAVCFDGTQWLKYTAADGLIDGQITTIMKGRDGSLWVAGQHQGKSGAARFDGTRWQVFSVEDGLVGDNIYTGYVSENGDVWLGTKSSITSALYKGGGVMRYDGASWTIYGTADGLIDDVIYDMAQTPDGAMWFGTWHGLSRFDPSAASDAWTNYELAEAEGQRKVRTLAVTQDGSLWLGQAAPDGGARRFDGKTWTHFTFENGLLDGGVWNIYEDRDGLLWFVTSNGLNRFDGKTWTYYRHGDDIPEFEVESLSTVRGLAQTSDGAFWLRRGDQVMRFMPDKEAPETILEPATEVVSSAGNILLKWSGRDLWNHTPMDRVRFQWRLNKGAWSPAWNRRDHTFTALSDGQYTLEVRAMDRDGNVDATPVVHAFIVEGPWWKNPWAFGTIIVFVLITGFQTSRIVRNNRKLQEANGALSSANHDLFNVNQELQNKTEDLEVANQELQRDGAVARIRGEIQSMKQASDFEQVLSLLSEDLKAVGLSFDSCAIDVLDESVSEPTMADFEKDGFRYTTYKLDPDGRVTDEAYTIAAPFPDMTRETIERFLAGEPWQGRSGQTAIVEVPVSSYGRLRITASDREHFEEDEVATVQDFAGAIALGYARYQDFQDLEAANREVKIQTERKSAFLASMSHELRTPMNAILGFTGMVLRRAGDVLPERQKENLGKVMEAGNHLLGLINDLLDLSKIEAGRMDVEVKPFSVEQLVETCCGTVEPLVKAGVVLKSEVDDGVGEMRSDEGKLRHVIGNLLSNAVKFTEDGEIRVRVRTVHDQLIIAVSDTGIGMPQEALETVFDEFQQVGGGEQAQKGTGLGLAISKQYAELLGGTVGVESEVGKGTTFTVRVPVVYKG